MKLFQSIDVWRRESEREIVRFRCFRSLVTGRFIVQSKDHYHEPFDQKSIEDLDRNFLELLSDVEPSERGEYDSLVEAITAFEESFADFSSEGMSASA